MITVILDLSSYYTKYILYHENSEYNINIINNMEK